MKLGPENPHFGLSKYPKIQAKSILCKKSLLRHQYLLANILDKYIYHVVDIPARLSSPLGIIMLI